MLHVLAVAVVIMVGELIVLVEKGWGEMTCTIFRASLLMFAVFCAVPVSFIHGFNFEAKCDVTHGWLTGIRF